MDRLAAVNASPWIVLARTGQLELLRALAPRIVCPDAVAEEVRGKGLADPAAQALAEIDWVDIIPPLAIPLSVLSWDLGPGESALIAWGLQNRPCTLVVDDRRARQCAELHGLEIRGTLGVILAAKQKGLIPLARPVLERIRSAGLFMSEPLFRNVLKRAGE